MSSKVAQERTSPATQPASAPPRSIRAAIFGYLRGNLGPLPVILTLIIIAAFFQSRDDLFLSPRNLNFLVLQIATLGCIALAAALVMLIGEIDLSLVVVSYLTGAVTVYALTSRWPFGPPLPAFAAILLGLAVGALIGLGNGFFVAILRVPSFIVTLAGLLVYQGVVIRVLFPQTSLLNHDPFVESLATTYLADPTTLSTNVLSTFLGIGLPMIAVLLYGGATLFARLQRQRRGLAVGPLWAAWLRVGVAIALVIGIIVLFENYLGIPVSAMIWIGLVLLFWLILRFTAYGHHVYAVGGNAEAARRAGINVTGVRISIFMLASMLATVAGLLAVSRGGSATSQVSPTLLLNAIAAAVIGGVSLFGGRGAVWSIVLGALVIGSIENGLALLQQNPDVRYIVEGVVLVIAVTADALTRRQGLRIPFTRWIQSLEPVLRRLRRDQAAGTQ